jgi:hypothetical protein
MILKFPQNMLKIALVNQLIPSEIAQKSIMYDFDDCLLVNAKYLAKNIVAKLQEINVQIVKKNVKLKNQASCWAELVPLEKDPNAFADKLTMFQVKYKYFTKLIGELLRLQCDQLSVHWNDHENEAVVLAKNPPHFAVLCADKFEIDAFTERQPDVWVSVGFSHPINIQNNNKIILISQKKWTIFEKLTFTKLISDDMLTVPVSKTKFNDAKPKIVMSVTPSLKKTYQNYPEMWVLSGINAQSQFARFVENSSDQLLKSLEFAVSDQLVVIRAKKMKIPPVVVIDQAAAYSPYLKLPNLFVPCDKTIHPNLRRDVVRKLLCVDQKITWLKPTLNNNFVPESIPECAFKTIWDTIEYKTPITNQFQPWMQKLSLNLQSFFCPNDNDENQSQKINHKPNNVKLNKTKLDNDNYFQQEFVEKETPEILQEITETFSPPEKIEPGKLEKLKVKLENEFLNLEGGLDNPQRVQLWSQLANVYSQLEMHEESGVAWTNAIWEKPSSCKMWSWFLAEIKPVLKNDNPWINNASVPNEIPPQNLDNLLAIAEPSSAETRSLAAYLAWLSMQPSISQNTQLKLPKILKFLEKNEGLLPTRAFWLAWFAVYKIFGQDSLTLAKARDRILERLFQRGPRPEQDLPSFLRFVGDKKETIRLFVSGDWLVNLFEIIVDWIKNCSKNIPQNSAKTEAYVNLVFSFGLAKIGEMNQSKRFFDRANKELENEDPAHQFLLKIFKYRTEQAAAGKFGGPIPKKDSDSLDSMNKLNRYVVDRFRKYSLILEPDQRINPYRFWGSRTSELDQNIINLLDMVNRDDLACKTQQLLAENPKSKINDHVKVVKACLDVAPKIGEEFAKKILECAITAFDLYQKTNDDVTEHAAFLERAMFVAGHFARLDVVAQLVNRFRELLKKQKLESLDALASQCFRNLRKLGMKDEIETLLKQISEMIVGSSEIKKFDFKKNHEHLRALLNVASGWLYFGKDSLAQPVLDAAINVIAENNLHPREQTAVIVSYAKTIAQIPSAELARKRLMEIFEKSINVYDTFTTSSHFSISQLDVVETVVLAVVGDDASISGEAKRWLDEDEFLVRKRIHLDTRNAIEN